MKACRQSGSWGFYAILNEGEGVGVWDLKGEKRHFMWRWKSRYLPSYSGTVGHREDLVSKPCLVPLPHVALLLVDVFGDRALLLSIQCFRQPRGRQKSLPEPFGPLLSSPENYPHARVAHPGETPSELQQGQCLEAELMDQMTILYLTF